MLGKKKDAASSYRKPWKGILTRILETAVFWSFIHIFVKAIILQKEILIFHFEI